MFYTRADRDRARRIESLLHLILTKLLKLDAMPTEADLQSKLNDLEAAVVAAVETETAELTALLASVPGIPQSALDRVDAMRTNIAARIAGIVTPPTTEPPTEPPTPV